jgi:hypothetical protein
MVSTSSISVIVIAANVAWIPATPENCASSSSFGSCHSDTEKVSLLQTKVSYSSEPSLHHSNAENTSIESFPPSVGAGDGNQLRASGVKDRLSDCVNAYADGLAGIRHELSQSVRNYSLIQDKISQSNITFVAGLGSSGTSSLASALVDMGLTVGHHIELAPNDYYMWQDTLAGCWEDDHTLDSCLKCLHDFHYNSLGWQVDAAADVPICHVFIDLFLSFPNSKWILNTRPSHEWVESRENAFPKTVPPIEHPCFHDDSDNFTTDELARMADLHAELVRCAVPPERLFEFDLFTNGTDGLMHDISRFLNLSEEYPRNASYPYVSNSELMAMHVPNWFDKISVALSTLPLP